MSCRTPIVQPDSYDLLLIDEKICLHEHVFCYDHLQLSHSVEEIICFFNFLCEQLDLHLQVFELFLNDGNMVGQLLDTKFQTFDGFSDFPKSSTWEHSFVSKSSFSFSKCLACFVAIWSSCTSITSTSSKDFRFPSIF